MQRSSDAPAPLLIQGAEVWAPEPLGRRDLLCAGGRIVAMAECLDRAGALDPEVLDARGLEIVPALIDIHCHVAGAGGEGGPATRTAEIAAATLLEAGISTVVGLLGADGVTRGLDNLLMKVKGLRQQGLGAWMWTGSYQLPPPTLTGDVARDIALFDEVLGVGEVAIADHRSSSPTSLDLVRLAKQARLGGMLSGSCGLVHLHMGDAERPFALIDEAVERSELAHAQFLPTHVNRNAACFAAALEYALRGPLDVTASAWPYFRDEEVKPSRAVRDLLAAGAPPDAITMSTDAGGSLPQFDAEGRLQRMATGDPARLWLEIVDAIQVEGLAREQALAVATRNPARRLRLAGRGELRVGAHADLLLIDEELRIRQVVAGGGARRIDDA